MHQAIQGIQDLTGSVWGTLAAMGASGRTTRVLFTSPDEGAGNTSFGDNVSPGTGSF